LIHFFKRTCDCIFHKATDIMSGDTAVLCLPVEVLEHIISFLPPQSVLVTAQVCTQWHQVSRAVSRAWILANIPSDVFTEIAEELRIRPDSDISPFTLEILNAWMESQISSEVTARKCELQAPKLGSKFLGTWGPHRHGHQLVSSLYTVHGSRLYVGDAKGDLYLLDSRFPSPAAERFCYTENIQDGSVQEVELWLHHDILVVSGDSKIHFFRMSDLERITVKGDLAQGDNKHLSCFGSSLSFSPLGGHTVRIVQMLSSGGEHRLEKVVELLKTEEPVQWKLWQDTIIAVMVKGTIQTYKRQGGVALLKFETEPNMMLMYKVPCFLYRDVIFCSTASAAGLIARSSYWLVGWNLVNDGPLFRALDQDKINPLDDIWCVSLRRNLMGCGTEAGCILLYNSNKTELPTTDICQGVPLKRGHSIIELELEKYKKPVFKKVVSQKPILSIDLGFSDSMIYIFYRTDITEVLCIVLDKCDIKTSSSL